MSREPSRVSDFFKRNTPIITAIGVFAAIIVAGATLGIFQKFQTLTETIRISESDKTISAAIPEELTLIPPNDNSCRNARNAFCDDDGVLCEYGTDLRDCGRREAKLDINAIISKTISAAIPEELTLIPPNDNSCVFARDNECDDDGALCEYGTDIDDCGRRGKRLDINAIINKTISAAISEELTLTPPNDNSCTFAGDNECDDSGIICRYGTDIDDCGRRGGD